MNKKGIGLFSIMVFILIFVMAVTIFGPTIKEFASDARSPANLDCENATLSIGERTTCIAVDLVLPYFIAALLALAGAVLVKE